MLLGNETALLRVSHVLLGKIVGGYELGMEALSCRSWDAGVDWVTTRGSNQYFPISEVIVREPSNVCIRTVLHECILTICTSHAALSETRANQCLCRAPFESWFGYRTSPKKQSQISRDPKPPISANPNNRRGFAPRLLCMGSQGCTFCNSIMLLEK